MILQRSNNLQLLIDENLLLSFRELLSGCFMYPLFLSFSFIVYHCGLMVFCHYKVCFFFSFSFEYLSSTSEFYTFDVFLIVNINFFPPVAGLP